MSDATNAARSMILNCAGCGEPPVTAECEGITVLRCASAICAKRPIGRGKTRAEAELHWNAEVALELDRQTALAYEQRLRVIPASSEFPIETIITVGDLRFLVASKEKLRQLLQDLARMPELFS